MGPEKIYEDLSLVRDRARKVLGIVAVLFVGVVLYYWKVQVLDYRKYWKLAEANRLRERTLSAPRGVIMDRNGTILADNTAGFKVSFIRENCRDYEDSLRRISGMLGIEEETLRKRIEKGGKKFFFEPAVIKDNLAFEEVALIEARKLEFPELVVEVDPKRLYRFGRLAAHVLGYLQELTPEEVEREGAGGRRWGDMIGRTGIERQYDGRLVGRDGKLLEIVDNVGKSQGELGREEPRQGENIRLTLDYDLQKTAEELLEGREGAIVVLDVVRDEVLAMASYPTYDPNKFISRFTPDEWMNLVNDPAYPMENRAVRGLYSPGSIFKIVMGMAGLDAGFVNEDSAVFCGGSTSIYGHSFSCWFKPGHGLMNIGSGIKNSCNIYFYNLGRRMGIDAIARYGKMMGLGAKTGIDLPGEKEGLVPSSEWKMKAMNAPWFPGETISVAIGQGPLLVTPLQIAAMTALVAKRGIPSHPRLVAQDAPVHADPRRVEIRPSAFEGVIQGMWRSVNDEGTGKSAKVAGFDVCGKTGSTQVISTERAEKLARQNREVKTHSWFSGFAPRDKPLVAVTILVEYGGGGGATAAPLAQRLFELFRRKYD